MFSLACFFRLFLYPANGSLHSFSRPRPLKPPQTPIPANIWQIYFSDVGILASIARRTNIWRRDNSYYNHHLVDKASAVDYVTGAYSTRPDVIEAFESLTIPVLKSDYLRYLLLASYGGVYADVSRLPTTYSFELAGYMINVSDM